MRFCPTCGTERSGTDAHCRKCGREFRGPNAADVPASGARDSRGVPEPPVQDATQPSAASRRSRLPLIAGAVVLTFGVGTAAAVLASQGGSKQPHRPPKLANVPTPTNPQSPPGGPSSSSSAAPTVSSPSTGPGTGSTSTAQTPTTPAPQAKTSAVPVTSSTPLGAVEHYWADIHMHDFAAAYGYLLPGSIEKTEGQFIAEEKREHVGAIQFRGTVSSRSGSGATVAVLTLITHDSTYGCRGWSGSYEMQESSGDWLIGRANLSPRPCG
jgi:hypothetical protein